MGPFGIFRIFCTLIFDRNKRHKGLVSVIKQNGQMLSLDVQEIRIQPYFCVKQGDYFFSLLLGYPVFYRSMMTTLRVLWCIDCRVNFHVLFVIVWYF